MVLECYSKSIVEGNGDARFKVHEFYIKEMFLNRDYIKASWILDPAIKLGESRATRRIGSMYYFGQGGLLMNKKHTLYWFQMSIGIDETPQAQS